MERQRIVACIPCYNEESHIASVIVKTLPHVDKVVVCDDGSKDLTARIAERLGAEVIRHDSNLGKGVALSDLFRAARNLGASIVVTLDGDGQHDPDEIPRLVAPIEAGKADLVSGAREIGEGMPGHRKAGNALLTGATNAASGAKLADSQSGFRAYSRKAIDAIRVAEHGIGVDSQIIVDAFAKGLRVEEIPVGVAYGEDTSTYGAGRQGVYVLLTIIRTVTERSPLLYLGVPSLFLLVAGALFGADLLALYSNSHFFSVPLALASIGLIFVGLVLAVGAMLLYAMNNLAVRLRHG